MPSLQNLSTAQLRQALALSEQIDTMQQRLDAILGGPEPTASAAPAKTKGKGARGAKGKRTMSAEGRERIAAAARARWAKLKSGGGKTLASAAKPGRGKSTAAKLAAPAASAKKPAAATGAAKKGGGLTDAGRARLAAAMKARWEARRRGGAGA